MDLRDQFGTVLAEFGELMGTPLALDKEGLCWFQLDGEFDVRLVYNEEEQSVSLWASTGCLPADAATSGLVRRLLLLCGDAEVARGFTLGLDDEQRVLGVCGTCPAVWLYSVDCMAEWLERFIGFIRRVREELEGVRNDEGQFTVFMP